MITTSSGQSNQVVRTWIRAALNRSRALAYAAIGLIAVAIDLGVFLLLDRRGVAPLLANSASVGLAVAFSFLANARFTFGVRDRIVRRFAAFASVSFAGFLLGQVILLVLISLGVAAGVAKVLSIPVVVGMQYIVNTNWTFASHA